MANAGIWKWAISTLLPSLFKTDIPGYIIGKSMPLGPVATRNVFLPESLIVDLENQVISRRGTRGKAKLYKLGKQFGYRFSVLTNFPKGAPGHAIRAIMNYFEALYAEKIDTKTDVHEKTLQFRTEDMAVTRVNGGGYCLTVGGAAGIWAYLLDDYSVECSVEKRGERECDFLVVPRGHIKKLGKGFIECKEKPEDLGSENYIENNRPSASVPHTAWNLQKLMETDIFTYRRGELKFALSDTRFIPVEIWLPYQLEMQFGDFCFEAARESFAEIGRNLRKEPYSYEFLCQLLTAFGFGYVDYRENGKGIEIELLGYPWIENIPKNFKFPLLQGAICGFLQGNTNKKVKTGLISAKLEGNLFNLRLSVK